MAWKSARKHLSIEKFEREQKAWKIIGLAALAVLVLVVILLYAYHYHKF